MLLRKTRIPILKITVALIICLTVYYLLYFGFEIQIIEVEGHNVQLLLDEQKLSKNLLFFPSEKIARELVSESPTIESVIINKKYPHTLHISIKQHQPIAILVSPNQKLLISKNGVVIGDAIATTTLPQLIFNEAIVRPGSFITNEQIKFSLNLITVLPEELIILKVFSYDTNSIRLESENMQIIISQKKEITESMATLQNLISGFRIKGIMPKHIDLRFDKPIIQ